MKKIAIILCIIGVSLPAVCPTAGAEGFSDIALPAPRMEGGKPLMEALKERQSVRIFSPEVLPLQVVSDLLWAAFGINRPESGRRSAPSARNRQEIDVYAVTGKGAYLYDHEGNSLKAVARGDLRKLTGTQEYVGTAPLNLVYVADTTRMEGIPTENLSLYAGAATGLISQNVYLFCASEGLATVVRASIDRDALAEALNLPEHATIILSQSVGYPGAR